MQPNLADCYRANEAEPEPSAGQTSHNKKLESFRQKPAPRV